MSADITTDVLVCGLGPAGASAALAAAKAGTKVVAVERNGEPGLPVQCAEFVPMMIGSEMPDVRNARVQNIDRMLTYVEDDIADVTPDFRGYMIDRARFDAELVEQARSAGAQCRFSSPLRTIKPSGIAELRDGTTIQAHTIIAADGPHSPVGKAVGNVNVDLVETRQITADLLVPHGGTDIFLHPEIVGGYGWLFPKGATCNIGIGVAASHKHTLKPLLARLHAMLIANGRTGAVIRAHTGGSIPVGGMLQLHMQFGDAHILFCGDAAGLTNPVTGAGINSAVISGKLAGEAVEALTAGDRHAAEDYCEEIAALFGTSIALALRRRHDLLEAKKANGRPGAQHLRDGWIAYPQYWADHVSAAAASAAAGAQFARSTP